MADSNSQTAAGKETDKMCWQCGRTFTTAMEVCPDDGARLIETDIKDQEDPLIGTVFDGRFRIFKKLGEGGMGTVYSARRLDFETDVALKLLKLDFTHDDGIRKRFMYEARVISNLKHPHAVRLFDFGQTAEGHVYMVMELLEGESLADRLSYRFVTYREVFNIIPPICGVLGEAHTRDVIHRDLKPENIYLLEVDGNDEFPKLLDFGIAKHNREQTMTKSGTLWGTPAYMSPEQARGDAVGAPADIYGIGIMLFELISGNLPFNATTQMGYAVKHINEPVRPLSSLPGLSSVPDELDEFLVSMLAKEPEQRPESMEVVATTLNRIFEEQFEDEILDSVPAQEIDPIGLQRWMKEAPDVSQDLPLEQAQLSGEEDDDLALAETGVYESGPNLESDSGQLRQTEPGQTAVVEERESRAMAATAALSEDEIQSQSADSDADDQSEKHGGDKRILAPVAVGLAALVLIAGVSWLLIDFEHVDQDDGVDAEAEDEAVAVDGTEDDTAPGDGAEMVGAGNVVPAAASQALTVIFQAHGIAQEIDPDAVEEEFEGEFDFLYESTEEAAESDEGTDSGVDEQRLREALERTF